MNSQALVAREQCFESKWPTLPERQMPAAGEEKSGDFHLSALRVVLSAILCFIPLLATAKAQSSLHFCTYQYRQLVIEVNGHDVLVESYRPDGNGPFPLVFMLHGSAGAFTPESRGEPATDNFGEKSLAHNCFAVVLPHYLQAIGQKSITSEQEMTSRFPELLAATESLLTDAEMLPWVKGQPVYLFGESLGGYLSIALSFRRSEVAAASEYGGGMPPGSEVRRTTALRVLISHGEADDLVPVSEAKALQHFCIDRNLSVELNVYPGEGHYLSAPVRTQILSRTVRFFGDDKKHPGQGSGAHGQGTVQVLQ